MAREAEGFGFLYSDESRSAEELCATLGSALGLERPVPVAVMRRALVDRTFAFHLINSRGNAELLGVLFADPRNRRYEEEDDEPPPSAEGRAVPANTQSSVALALKAGQAAVRWGAAGFRKVPPEVFETRFGACRRCEYLVEPADRVIYKVRLRKESDPRVCSACGCVAARKAALPTESCPVPHSDDPSLNRWGEPIERGRATSS